MTVRIYLINLIAIVVAVLGGCSDRGKPVASQAVAAVRPCEASQAFVDTINSLTLGLSVDEARKALKAYPQTDSLAAPKEPRDAAPKARVLRVYPSPACMQASSQQLFVEVWFKDTVHLSGLFSNIKGIKPPRESPAG